VSDINGSVLHEAVRIGSLSMANYFLTRGADVNLNRNETPLLVAVKNTCPSIELVKLLLKKHADPNLISVNKQLALHEAIALGRLDVAELLLDFKADVNLKFNGRTALHFAMAHSDDAVLLILKYGADPNVISDRKELVLHIAIASGRMEIAKLLLDYKADPNLKCNVRKKNRCFSLIQCCFRISLHCMLLWLILTMLFVFCWLTKPIRASSATRDIRCT
jgi:ankyrin repeat protein